MEEKLKGRGRPRKDVKADEYIGVRITEIDRNRLSEYRRSRREIPSEASVIRECISEHLRRKGF